MKLGRSLALALGLWLVVAGMVSGRQLSLVRAGNGDLRDLASEYGFEILSAFHDRGDRVALVAASYDAATLRDLLSTDPRVIATEPADDVALVEAGHDDLRADPGDLLPNLLSSGVSHGTCLERYLGPEVWSGYGWQLAAEQVDLGVAQEIASRCGDVTVAVIDTGVDERHPLLESALLEGYDFLLDQPWASEWSSIEPSQRGRVEQSITAIVDQSITAIVDGYGKGLAVEQSITAIVDQSITAIVDDYALPSAFGHGTMTAGLVRLVAPAARIMPLRAFDGEGHGRLFDVVRAIRWAADRGADVINLSFSIPTASAELAAAIDYASSRGAVCVAAAGNRGSTDLVFPAGLAKVWGVGATTSDDRRAPFSSYGEKLVRLAAPGEGVVSLYPGGLYAAGWGTSFSAPLVTGSVALLLGERGSGRELKLGAVLDAIRDKAHALGSGDDLGTGRLDVGSAARKLLGADPVGPDENSDSDG